MELALCAGCLLCAHQRDGVRVCRERFIGKKIQQICDLFTFTNFFFVS